MKTRFLHPPLLAVLLAACNQDPAQRADDQRQSDEKRLTELRDLEQRALQREAEANAAEIARERQRLADQQAGLDAEKQKLAAEKAAIREDAAKLAQWRADEQRLQQRQAALKADQDRSALAERQASTDRERAREAGRQAQQDSAQRQLDYFYAPLDPLGDWIEVAPYGYCWQPREARTVGWRPYTDGTWVFTDYGWTWNANEPFGWATYHYGRWARIKRLGWVWVPGSEWAPAWVAWRRSDQYVGWAPLPPEAHSGTGFNAGVDSYYDIGPGSYNFVPAASFGEPTYRGIVVEPERNVTIVPQTVNVTRINYTTVENKTVVFNGGPELVQINAASARPVQRVRLERVSDRPADSGSAAIVGNVLKLLAPRIISASKPNVAPGRVKEAVKAAEVERGWSGGDAPAVQAARAQVRQEAGQAEQQARVAVPAEAGPVVSRKAAREAEGAQMSAAKAAEAANMKQAEAQKKAMAEAAAAQQEEAKRAGAEKRAADMKAQAEADTAAKEAARMAGAKEAEAANMKQADAQKKAMAEAAAAQQEKAKRADERRKAEKAAADKKAQAEAAAVALREKEAAAPKAMPAPPPTAPVEATTPPPAAPRAKPPETVPPTAPDPSAEPEKKGKGPEKREADKKEKAAREASVTTASATTPAAIDPREAENARRAAKQKDQAERKRTGDAPPAPPAK